MSLHKLTAGSGYDYLTRQVAALDATEKGHAGLASVLHRTGRDARGLDRLGPGRDRRPERRRPGDRRADAGSVRLRPASVGRAPAEQLEGPAPLRDIQEATRLGVPFKIVDGHVSPFRVEVAKRIVAIKVAAGAAGGRAASGG